MPPIDFSTWFERVKASLAEIEHRYDLAAGEMFLVANTSSTDLRELHRFGWSAAEASACIIENAGLR